MRSNAQIRLFAMPLGGAFFHPWGSNCPVVVSRFLRGQHHACDPSFQTLYCIDECPDLMADGCVGDEHGNLVFLSIWARDTAVQEFLARLTLGRDAQGLDRFHVITDQRKRPTLRRQRREPGESAPPRLPSHAIRPLTNCGCSTVAP